MLCDKATVECLIFQANIILEAALIIGLIGIGVLIVAVGAAAVIGILGMASDGARWCWRKVRRTG